jgi:UTP--glucose-1-phosphate uridylyltransferase
MDISKVVIPAAGLGTRFLPWTKAMPKEMLPLLDMPAIHYIVQEALSSNIKNIFMITGKGKEAIVNYFDSSPELEAILKERNRSELLSDIDRIIRNADFTYIRQPEPLGLGDAVWRARHSIGKEYFGVMLPDDIVVSSTPALDQLIRIARQEKASVIAVQEVPAECVSSYGVIGIKKQITPKLFQVSHLVEKPHPKDAPSNLAVIGRYVLSHKVLNSLEETSAYAIGELQLTDAISHMVKNGEKLIAYKIQGTRYDTGTPIGWLKATIGMALQNPLYAPHIKKFLADIDTPNSFIYDQRKNIEHSL